MIFTQNSLLMIFKNRIETEDRRVLHSYGYLKGISYAKYGITNRRATAFSDSWTALKTLEASEAASLGATFFLIL